MEEININNFDEKLYYEKLSNGLRVFLVPFKYKKNFFATLVTKFGGKDLDFIVNGTKHSVPSGTAHFLEHKLFEGSKSSPFKFYSKSGTDVNASTNYECTKYYFSGNYNFYSNLKYFVNWLNTFSISDDKVEKEKGIILEEASMYKDNPTRVLYEKLLCNTLVNNNRKLKVIGTDQDIKSITKEDLELCYKTFYNPSNMCLVIGGNFNKDKAFEIIKNEYSKYSYEKIDYKLIVSDEPDNVSLKDEVIKMDVDVPKVGISYKVNKKLFNIGLDKYFLDYYLYMIFSIGCGQTSDFYEKLFNEGYFTSTSFEWNEIESHYLLSFYATSNFPLKLIEKLKDYLKNIELKEEDFIRTKKTWIASEVRMIDSINSTVKNIVDDIIDYDSYKNNRIDDIKSLTFDNLLKVKDCILFDNYSTVIIQKD